MDGAHVLNSGGLVRRDAEEVSAPDARVLLLPHDLTSGRVGLELEADRLRLGGVGTGKEFRQRAIADGRTGVLQEPGARNLVARGEFQVAPPWERGTVKNRGRAKLPGEGSGC